MKKEEKNNTFFLNSQTQKYKWIKSIIVEIFHIHPHDHFVVKCNIATLDRFFPCNRDIITCHRDITNRYWDINTRHRDITTGHKYI